MVNLTYNRGRKLCYYRICPRADSAMGNCLELRNPSPSRCTYIHQFRGLSLRTLCTAVSGTDCQPGITKHYASSHDSSPTGAECPVVGAPVHHTPPSARSDRRSSCISRTKWLRLDSDPVGSRHCDGDHLVSIRAEEENARSIAEGLPGIHYHSMPD